MVTAAEDNSRGWGGEQKQNQQNTFKQNSGNIGKEDWDWRKRRLFFLTCFFFLVANVDPQFLLKIAKAIFKINMMILCEGRKTMAGSNR